MKTGSSTARSELEPKHHAALRFIHAALNRSEFDRRNRNAHQSGPTV